MADSDEQLRELQSTYAVLREKYLQLNTLWTTIERCGLALGPSCQRAAAMSTLKQTLKAPRTSTSIGELQTVADKGTPLERQSGADGYGGCGAVKADFICQLCRPPVLPPYRKHVRSRTTFV